MTSPPTIFDAESCLASSGFECRKMEYVQDIPSSSSPTHAWQYPDLAPLVPPERHGAMDMFIGPNGQVHMGSQYDLAQNVH